jgi:hypothetical protein
MTEQYVKKAMYELNAVLQDRDPRVLRSNRATKTLLK